MYETTPYKRVTRFLDLIRSDRGRYSLHFINVSLGSTASEAPLFFKAYYSTFLFNEGVKGITINNIDKTKSINGIGWDRFTFKGFNRDRYR